MRNGTRNHITGIKILGAAAILASALASPAIAQEVIYNPGYCAQFYPNANCQNKGPGNPYTGSYQRQAYGDNRTWHGRTAAGAGTATAAATPDSGRAMSQPAPAAASPMRVRTALSVPPVKGSAARTATCISAGETGIEGSKRRPAGRLFHAGKILKRALRFWPFADKSDIRAAEDQHDPAGTSCWPPIASIRRFSSAVEQRFCKPKVGSSILSTGTSEINNLALKSRFSEG